MSDQDTSITTKEWLDLAWKYFLQHAQQRLQYFNYFVIFSTIITTGIVTTFQYNFQAHYLGIGLGIIQTFLSYMFWKIDIRNKFLTQHAEQIIKKIEEDCCSTDGYKLFTQEDSKTALQTSTDKKSLFFKRQISHSKSYGLIYNAFFIVGIVGIIISCCNSFGSKKTDSQKSEPIVVKFDSLARLEERMSCVDSLSKQTLRIMNELLQKNDSLKKLKCKALKNDSSLQIKKH